MCYSSTPITREIELILQAQEDLEFAERYELIDTDFWRSVIERRTENYRRLMHPQKESASG